MKILKPYLMILLSALFVGETSLAQSINSQDPGTKGVPTSRALKQIAQNLKKYGLSRLPSAAAVVEQSVKSKSRAGVRDVSGTPPTLSEIASGSAKNIFWRPGVVDAIAYGTPTTDQCEEFFGSGADGESGGFGACQMASDVGQAFDTILEADLSRCYMQNLPTQKNVDSGGIIVTKGKFPNDDVTQIFSVGKKPRLIKARVGAMESGDTASSIFIRISSASENKTAGLIYRAEIYNCEEGQTKARGFDSIEVDDQGKYTLYAEDLNESKGSASYQATITGYLEKSGIKTGWDEDSTRSALVQFSSQGDSFKTQFDITSEDLIFLKSKYGFENEIDNNYSISHFNGRSVKDAVFLEGAFKDISDTANFDFNFSGATEYRDPFYAFAPDSSLLALAAAYDIDSDPFYADLPNFTIDTSEYSCSAKADIEIEMKQNKTIKESLKICSRNQLEDMDFCRNDEAVLQAERNYPNVCQ